MDETGLGDKALEIESFALVPYCEALEYQRKTREAVLDGTGPEKLIALEHPPTVTWGRRTPLEDLAGNGTNHLPRQFFESRSAFRMGDVDYVPIERGGRATYHAPGQLVVYPIINLKKRNWGVREFLIVMQRSIVELAEELGLEAYCAKSEAGVWIGSKKLASFGIHVRRGVTLHGLALNVEVDLSGFQCIRPCGENPEVMTSLSDALHRPVRRLEIEPILIHNLKSAILG